MVSDWRELKALIAGCGSIGKRHGRILRELGVKQLLACDPIPEQRKSFIEHVGEMPIFESYEQGLRARPDVVFICTPPRMHVPMALEAIRANCHVFCEKPLADTLEGTDKLEREAAEAQKIVMVGLCFRYHAGLRAAKRMLEEGRIGRLVSIRCLMGEHLPSVRPDYRALFSAQYSGAFDLTHEVDLAVWFAQKPAVRVAAVAGAWSDIGIQAPDIAEILVQFGDRTSGHLPCAASIHLDFFQRPRRRQTELIGTEGVIIVEFARWDECNLSLYEAEKGSWTHERISTDRDDMFRDEDREFLQAVAEDKPVACDIAEAVKSVAIVQRAREAAGVTR